MDSSWNIVRRQPGEGCTVPVSDVLRVHMSGVCSARDVQASLGEAVVWQRRLGTAGKLGRGLRDAGAAVGYKGRSPQIAGFSEQQLCMRREGNLAKNIS